MEQAWMLMFMLLLGAVACDVFGQVSFKLGLSGRSPSIRSETAAGGMMDFVRGLAASPWIGVGIAIYAIEFVLWFAALSLAPLSLAVAFAAFSYCGVVLASRAFLNEHVSARQWRATCVIAIGVVLVCWSHAH
jgi:drug/metabolite transporter (DMT)-like permease